MQQLDAQYMLTVWERCLNQAPLNRALILLVAAYPEFSPGSVLQMSIGQRDKYLFLLRERLFGSALLNNAVCPKCSERIEWQNDVKDFITMTANQQSHKSTYELCGDGYQICFRLPTSSDVAEVMKSGNYANADRELLARCVIEAVSVDGKVDVNSLPEEILTKAAKQIELLDPQAEISIELKCPDCTHAWSVLFDISSFLWTELNAWAEHTLQMIHKLAKAYGWTESAILGLNPVRRQIYLAMVSA